MKALVLFGILLVGAHSRALAAEINVSASALEGWTVSGERPVSFTTANALVLPAGSALSRNFTASGLSVRLKTQPIFTSAAEDWPLLELDSATLAFVRSGDEGRLVLVADQREPEVLPYAFKLDGDGRALVPVELQLDLREGLFSVTHAGQTSRFETSAASTAVEFVISGGIHQPWAFEKLAIQTTEVSAIDAGAAVSSIEITSAAKTSNFRQALTLFDHASPGAQSRATKSPPNGTVSAEITTQAAGSNRLLEVFTPPSVRSVRNRIETHLTETAER